MNDWMQQIPPWEAFPGLLPADAGTRQGAQEAWVDSVWRPFWSGLTPEQRNAYFEHWHTSDEWRHAIRSTFELPAGFDAQADAAESETWLRQRAAEATAQPPWYKRLGRILGKT